MQGKEGRGRVEKKNGIKRRGGEGVRGGSGEGKKRMGGG